MPEFITSCGIKPIIMKKMTYSDVIFELFQEEGNTTRLRFTMGSLANALVGGLTSEKSD